MSSNSAPDPAMLGAVWPASRLGEAMHALALETGLPLTRHESFSPPHEASSQDLDTWVRVVAERGGLQASRTLSALDEIGTLSEQAAPLLLRVALGDQQGFVAICGGRRNSVDLLGPDLRRRRIRTPAFLAAVRRPFEEPFQAETERTLDLMGIPAKRRDRAKSRLLAERVRGVRLQSCWSLRVPPGAPLRDQLRETRLVRDGSFLTLVQLAQYLLFVLSWWLLGRGALDGAIDVGWLAGWILLLFSLVPARMFGTWLQGVVSTTMGVALRRQLLRGALRLDRETIRRRGAGGLFGIVVESAAIESLALSGGLASSFAMMEIGVSAIVIWAGGASMLSALLVVWSGLTAWLAWRYYGDRRAWSRERLELSGQLLEAMVGHRTRLAQQAPHDWHPDEDLALAGYIQRASVMDRAGARLTALMPRGWLVVALAALTPATLSHASASEVAVRIGGVLLAYRSLRRLSTGLAGAAGAAIAAGEALPLVRAAGRQVDQAHPAALTPLSRDAASSLPVAQMRDVTFRYGPDGPPVLDNCSLTIPRGARLLLEGQSGAGKTTLASLLAGLDSPDAGLLLVDGLDRSVLGREGWVKRVVLASQAADNYLVSGTLAFNLLMGRRWPAQHADLVEAEQICREIGLGDLLDRLPGGLHQMVGETGWQLSQGERTRVFLARALLQKPELLVLDESFSALDPENVDRTVKCVLRRAPAVLAIAHV